MNVDVSRSSAAGDLTKRAPGYVVVHKRARRCRIRRNRSVPHDSFSGRGFINDNIPV